MKKKLVNNKGLTLVELIVSISLISIILLFIYQMIATVNYDRSGQDYAINNQAQRTEIIKYINYNYFIKSNTVASFFSINPNVNDRNYTNYTRISLNNVVSINVYKDKLELQSGTNTLKSWSLNTKDGIYYDFENIKVIDVDNTTYNKACINNNTCSNVTSAVGKQIPKAFNNSYYYLKIIIPIKTFTGADNFIDDIELTYMKHI